MAATGQDEEDEFKEVALIFDARKADPLPAKLIPELQRVIPSNDWQDFTQAAAETVKTRHYFMCWYFESCLGVGLTKNMQAVCATTNDKIGQETSKFVGPNVTLEFRRNGGQIGNVSTTHYGGYQSTDDRSLLCKEPDKYAVLVKYRRAAFFKTTDNK